MRQILRVIAALFAVAALTGGGTVAFADHGPGGSSGSASGEEHSGHHDGGDDNAGHDAGDDNGAKQQAGDNRKDDNQGPGKDDHGQHNRTADVYTLAEPQHGNPEGVAFDKRSGFFFVSATGDGSIYRGKLGDTATPVPVFIPGAAGQSATGLKVQLGKLYAAGAATGTIKVYDIDSGTLLATFDTKGGDSSPTFVNDLDVTKRGDVYATDSKRPAIYHLTAEEIAAGTPAPKPIAPADVISTSPEIPFNASPTAFNLNGIVVDDDRGEDQGRHHGDRHRHHGDRRADKLIVVDSDTGQLFAVKVGRDGNAARKIRELQVDGGPSPAATACSSTAASCSSSRARTRTTASPTASSTSSTCATAVATASLPTSAATPPSRGRRRSPAPAIATWWSTPTSPPAPRRSR